MSASVTNDQRYSSREDRPCPICGGGADDPRGEGVRCIGFVSGAWARCSRIESGRKPGDDGTYAHRLLYGCACGKPHPEPTWWKSRITKYNYVENDILIATHCRRDWPTGPKDMWWEGANGAPRLGRDPATLSLYGAAALGALPKGTPVVMVEGEKKAELFLALGIPSVATGTGAPGTHEADAFKVLLDYNVILWGDDDEPGRQQRRANADRLREIGHANVTEMVDGTLAPDDYLMANREADQVLVFLDQAVPVNAPTATPWQWANVLRGAAITRTRVTEPDALVKGLFTRNRQHAIIGASGSAKTWVMFDLSVCVACPEIDTFLGQPIMRHGPVVIESWEQGQSEDLRRLQKLLRGYRRTEAPDTLILASEPALTLNDDAAYQARLRDFTETGVVLYAFDSLSEGCGIELNDNTAYTAWWRARVRPMLSAGITVVFTHLRGHVQNKPGALADRDAVFRGATQIRALSQAAIECRQITETSSLLKHNKHRDTQALPFGTLNLVGDFEDPEIRLSLVAPLAKDVVRTASMRQMLLWLQANPGSSKTKIKNGVGFGQTKAYNLIDEATREGWITALEGEKGEVWSTAPDWRVRSESGAVESEEEFDA